MKKELLEDARKKLAEARDTLEEREGHNIHTGKRWKEFRLQHEQQGVLL